MTEPAWAVGAALDAYAKGESGSAEAWRDALDDLARRQGATVVFTTVRASPAPDADAAAAFSIEGDGQVSVTSRFLYLVTIGARRAGLQWREALPEGGDLVLHLAVSFTSNVGDNFYVVLRGDGDEETLRFSNHGVTLCADGWFHGCNPKVPTLFSLALGGGYAELHVNGCLRVRKRRPRRRALRRLRLELVGDPRADFGAQVLGLEVWRMERPGPAFVDGDGGLLGPGVDERLRRADANTLFETLAAVDDLALPGFPGRAIALLDGLIERTPYRDEVVDALLGRAGPARADAWLAANRHRLPRPIVTVRDLTVRFSRAPHRLMSLGRLLRRRDPERFDVLHGIGFALYPGDVLGIIGENGAGKSTLLRTLSGLIPIERGEVWVGGRHLLLRAGVGFREEATGRENVVLAGCYLQMSPREMRALVGEIVEFSELGEAIDRPLKYYSDGMRARLVFSLATSVSPEVLMLDELLGAGDVRFQDKAARRMDELIKRARAVIVVTHGLDFVRKHCTKALYLAKGRPRYFGHPEIAVSHYLNDLHLTGPTASV